MNRIYHEQKQEVFNLIWTDIRVNKGTSAESQHTEVNDVHSNME